MRLYPRFNFAMGKADVTVEYECDSTRVRVDADMDNQKITLSQRIDDDNIISPSISSDGDMSLEYRGVVGDGVLTANYHPSDSIGVRYEEGSWVAKADIPIEGYFSFKGNAKLKIGRSVTMETLNEVASTVTVTEVEG